MNPPGSPGIDSPRPDTHRRIRLVELRHLMQLAALSTPGAFAGCQPARYAPTAPRLPGHLLYDVLCMAVLCRDPMRGPSISATLAAPVTLGMLDVFFRAAHVGPWLTPGVR